MATGIAHSGGGPNQWTAASYAEFEVILAGGKPRDHYEIWSLHSLLAQGMALAEGRYDDRKRHCPSLFTAEQFQAIADYLSDSRLEVFALFFGTPRGPDCWVADDDEYVRECAQWYNLPSGQVMSSRWSASRRRNMRWSRRCIRAERGPGDPDKPPMQEYPHSRA